MAKQVIIEQLLLTFRAPPHLPATEDAAILRRLRSKDFQTRLRAGLQQVVRRYPALRKLSIRLER